MDDDKHIDNTDITNTENVTKGDTDTPASDNSGTAAPPRSRRTMRALGILGIICTVVAWVAFFFNDTVTVVSAVTGLALSLCGCFGGRGCRRDLCISATIASGVLLLVYAIFYWGIDYLLDKI